MREGDSQARSRRTPTIDVHLSVKVLHAPITGARPPASGSDPTRLLTDADVHQMVDLSNSLLYGAWARGYRIVLDEIVDLATPCSPCGTADPDYWYAVTFADNATPTMKDMETVAKAHTATFAWRTTAINLYVNLGKGNGAVASFPPPDPRSNDIVISGSRVFEPAYLTAFAAATITHELGHYFNLAHPNATLDDCCDPNTCILDGDGIADTPADGPCFTLDQLSIHDFGVPFASLPPAQHQLMDDEWTNNMTYLHAGQTFGLTMMDRRSEGQLDRWTDAANGVRAAVCSGRTWFVQAGAPGSGSGSSTSPFPTVGQGIAAARVTGGDIVLMRPGTYSQTGQLVTPLTLRATRTGAATVINPLPKALP